MADNLIDRSSCAALVITCSDFRFKSVERAFLEQHGLRDDYDLIARPGAIRALVEPRSEAARTTMEEEIRLLLSLHAFSRALLVNHMSCRAYDDLTAGADERAVHRDHLRRAAAAFGTLFPGVAAEPYLIEIEGTTLVVRHV